MATTDSASNATPAKEDDEAKPASGWLKRVPLLTGVLAAVAGFLAVRSTNLANDAIYRSNQAVLFQAKASDAWAEFQALSIKARIVQSAAMINPSAAATQPDDEVGDWLNRKPILKANAQKLEADRDEQLKSGTKQLRERDLLGYAGVGIQLGIALASVAAITRRRVAFDIAVIVGTLGVVLTGYAMAGHYLLK